MNAENQFDRFEEFELGIEFDERRCQAGVPIVQMQHVRCTDHTVLDRAQTRCAKQGEFIGVSGKRLTCVVVAINLSFAAGRKQSVVYYQILHSWITIGEHFIQLYPFCKSAEHCGASANGCSARQQMKSAIGGH